MKRTALLLVVASLLLGSSACATMTKGGARGPVIHKTDAAEPAQQEPVGSLELRPELGQR